MEFRNKLKTRMHLGIVYMLIGAVTAAAAVLLKMDNEFLPAFGVVMILCGLVRLWRYRGMIRSEETVRQQEVREQDERNLMIAQKAKSIVFYLYVLAASVGVIVCSVTNRQEVANLLGYTVCFLVGGYWICYYILQKKY